MGTVIEAGIVVKVPAEVLGPGSEYAIRRTERRKDWDRVVLEAKAVTVTDAESCEKATQAGRVLQASGREVEEFYRPVKQQIDSLKKPVLADEAADFAAIDTEKKRLGAEITEFNRKQAAIRAEEERVAREAAEKQAREELLARAVELEASGDHEQAEAVLDEEVVTSVVIQNTAPPRAAGQVSKVAYSMEITNLAELVKAVAAGKAPVLAVVADEAWLNAKARLDKEAYSVPGTKLMKKEGTHFRS